MRIHGMRKRAELVSQLPVLYGDLGRILIILRLYYKRAVRTLGDSLQSCCFASLFSIPGISRQSYPFLTPPVISSDTGYEDILVGLIGTQLLLDALLHKMICLLDKQFKMLLLT